MLWSVQSLESLSHLLLCFISSLSFIFILLLSIFPFNCIGTDLFCNLYEVGLYPLHSRHHSGIVFLLPLFHRVHFITSTSWFNYSPPTSPICKWYYPLALYASNSCFGTFIAKERNRTQTSMLLNHKYKTVILN